MNGLAVDIGFDSGECVLDWPAAVAHCVVNLQVREPRVNSGPGAASIGGLEDPGVVRPGVERRGGCRIEGQGLDAKVRQPAL